TMTRNAVLTQSDNEGISSSGNTAILNCFGDDTLWVTFSDENTATLLVTSATPSGTITLPGDGSTVTLRDTATLSGGNNPQGTITFNLTNNGTKVVYTSP